MSYDIKLKHVDGLVEDMRSQCETDQNGNKQSNSINLWLGRIIELFFVNVSIL